MAYIKFIKKKFTKLKNVKKTQLQVESKNFFTNYYYDCVAQPIPNNVLN